ncbi:hypothetical protein GCM10007901_19650 [Dyella acidisoli]|uniref:Uncharacterized protein n=1 Tax=Dyella acidisoli TaxID=1867834 RepID=A0ABQ5XMS7_9GAMM|nr:hypothetical protein GCM10007901_19650 [Dyella acidisoli]
MLGFLYVVDLGNFAQITQDLGEGAQERETAVIDRIWQVFDAERVGLRIQEKFHTGPSEIMEHHPINRGQQWS